MDGKFCLTWRKVSEINWTGVRGINFPTNISESKMSLPYHLQYALCTILSYGKEYSTHALTQVALCDFQNKATRKSPPWADFVSFSHCTTCVPACAILYHVTISSCKVPILYLLESPIRSNSFKALSVNRGLLSKKYMANPGIFAHHIPKPLTIRFFCLNGKQPRLLSLLVFLFVSLFQNQKTGEFGTRVFSRRLIHVSASSSDWFNS